MEDFMNQLTVVLSEMLGKDVVLERMELMKNNSVKLNALSVRRKGDVIVPALYMDEDYLRYKAGIISVNEVADKIISKYNNSRATTEKFSLNICNYDNVKNDISMRLVNQETNLNMLNNVPFVSYSNFAILFYIQIDKDNEYASYIQITNSMVEIWQIDKEILYSDALNASYSLNAPIIDTMQNVICSIMQNNDMKMDVDFETYLESPEMYILSNEQKLYGASVILYPNISKVIYEKTGLKEFFVLPSSVHELLLLPYSEESDKNSLANMIKNVNQEEVKREDFLSDNLYYYENDSNELKIIL